MKNTLVIVADLGCFKAFRLESHNGNQTPRLALVKESNNAAAHNKLVDKVSDLAGRFRPGTGAGNVKGVISDGERHNIALETRKRLVRELAQQVNALARDPEIERCLLAASVEINRQLLEQLEPQVRAKISRNLAADLTKIEQAELLRRF